MEGMWSQDRLGETSGAPRFRLLTLDNLLTRTSVIVVVHLAYLLEIHHGNQSLHVGEGSSRLIGMGRPTLT